MKILPADARRVAEGMLGIPNLRYTPKAAGAICCAGLVAEFYRRFEVDVHAPTTLDQASIEYDWRKDFFPVAPGEARDGDIVKFIGADGESKPHIGILVGKAVLHMSKMHGSIITPLDRLFRPPDFGRHVSQMPDGEQSK